MAEVYGVVYGLYDPRVGCENIRYIGQTTKTVKQRLSWHLRPNDLNRSNTYNSNWLKSLVKDNIKPKYVILGEANSKEELDNLEIFYIRYFKECGRKLTNQMLGGSSAGTGFKRS
jgi:hypothetical protein